MGNKSFMLRIFYTVFIFRTILLSSIFVGGVDSLVNADCFSSYVMYKKYIFFYMETDFYNIKLNAFSCFRLRFVWGIHWLGGWVHKSSIMVLNLLI